MAISTALANALDGALHGQGNAEELITTCNNVASLGGALTATATELNTNHGVTPGTVSASLQVAAGANKQVDTLAIASLVAGTTATPGAAGQAITVINRKTAVVDNTATSIFTVTCPNTEQAAIVEVILMASAKKTAGATYESTRVAVGYVVFDRTTGAALVGTATALTNAGIATSGTDTLTLAYSVGTVSGANSATQTMDIKVTCVGSGTDTHDVVALATIVNQAASGMTMASD
jgi:hypothetical protein